MTGIKNENDEKSVHKIDDAISNGNDVTFQKIVQRYLQYKFVNKVFISI